MASDMEVQKPPVTEIKVRMDCNGCVQKVKKALQQISGIEELHVDFSQQKITIIGWVDPEKVIKAIKKTKKRVIVCLHKEQSDDQPLEEAPEGEGEGIEGGEPETTDQQTEPIEAPREPELENPPLEKQPPEYYNGMSASTRPPTPRGHEEGHVIYHHQPDHGYRHDYGPNPQEGYNGQWNDYRGGPSLQQGSRCNDYYGDPRYRGVPSQQPQPVYVAHNYNTYKPSPYVTKFADPRSPQEPPQQGNPPPEARPVPEYANGTSPSTQPPKPKNPEEVHVVYRQPPNYGPQHAYGPNSQQGYNGHRNTYPGDPGFRGESSPPPQRPVYVSQSSNTYRVTKHERPRSPQEPPRPENPPHEEKQLPEYANGPRLSSQLPRDHERAHVMYHEPPKCGFQYGHNPNFQQGYNGPSNAYHGDPGYRGEPPQPLQPPAYAAHSYNTYKPSPYVTEYADGPNFRQGYNGQWDTYRGDMGFGGAQAQPPQPLYATQSYNTYKPSSYVTDYANPQSPPRYSHYSRPEYYSRDYYSGSNRNDTNITSMFSEENPNACTIV